MLGLNVGAGRGRGPSSVVTFHRHRWVEVDGVYCGTLWMPRWFSITPDFAPSVHLLQIFSLPLHDSGMLKADRANMLSITMETSWLGLWRHPVSLYMHVWGSCEILLFILVPAEINASSPQPSGTSLLLDLSEIVFILNIILKQFPANPQSQRGCIPALCVRPDYRCRWASGQTRLSSARLAGKLHVLLTKAVGRDCSSAPSAFTLCYPALSADFAGMNGSAQYAHKSKWPIAACPPSCTDQHYSNSTRKCLLYSSAFPESPWLL